MIDVSIIIVNYKTPLLVIGAIESIFKYTEGLSYELFVVDNASGDDSEEIVVNRFGKKVNFITLKENVGFGRGNNVAIERASGRNVFLFNSDAILMNNAIKILSDFLDNNDVVGACGANLYNSDLTPQPSFLLFYNSISSTINRLFGYYFGSARCVFNVTDKPQRVSVIFGAALMLKKAVLNEVGCFNPNFFMYAEEEELCLRIHRAKYLLLNIPQAKVLHLDGKSSNLVEHRENMRLEGLRIYYQLSYPKWHFLIVRFLYRIHVFSRLLFYSLIRNQDKKKYWMFFLKNPL